VIYIHIGTYLIERVLSNELGLVVLLLVMGVLRIILALSSIVLLISLHLLELSHVEITLILVIHLVNGDIW